MRSGYAMPVTAWLTRDTGERAVRLPDGREITVDEWRETRVDSEEFARLSMLKLNRAVGDPMHRSPEDPDDV
jgi:hypothetical protein